MNIDNLLQKYFKDCSSLPTIEVFDNENIYVVYVDIVKTLKNSPDIELGVLQLLSYCFYEILDNVLTHSGKKTGTVLLHHEPSRSCIKILVADDGMGIRESLSENEAYKNITEAEAIRQCLRNKVTDGKGMGFGLYSTSCLIKNAGVEMEVHSGRHLLRTDGEKEEVLDAPLWQGTIIYFELHTDREIDPNSILENRTDAEAEFNETFIDTSDLDELW
ncbi:MAG: sensor histidine kinase [Bacteroidaceae bacterium]|nr:sensor histidine kinase [Bacteroidaceae bacterium]